MEYKTIIFEREEDVAIIRFNRPKALNAINLQLMMETEDALGKIASDKSLRVLIMTGSGEKAFVAGADISELKDLTPAQGRSFSRRGQDLFFRLEELPIPVIACVNGFALGGGTELAMACDFIYAADSANFGQPEINLGIIPGFGGTQRLSRLVGKSMAKELCMTGVMLGAQEAKDIGLVNKVFPRESLWNETIKVAKLLASKGKASLTQAKESIEHGYDNDLGTGCQIESYGFGMCLTSTDAREGMQAFLEKRKPVFKGDGS